MVRSLPQSFDRTNAAVALSVWLLSLFLYNLTKAPTVSFWDCGEFIAVSYILGIPHPPGTPMYVLMGRVFSMIPFTEDISARLNFLSAFCSSVAVLFAYLAAVRILRHWFVGNRSLYSRILIYGGAASGAMFLAFGRTQWGNSVETEVYGMSMMLMMGILWLTLIYYERRRTILGDKLMLLVVYLAFLGIGVHMTTFLILPVSALVFILKKDTPGRIWFILAAFFLVEFFLIFALSSRPDEIPYYVPIVIVFVFYAFYVLSYEKIPRLLLLIGLGFLLACAPAFAALAGSTASYWSVIGLVSFLGMIAYSGYILVIGKLRRREGETISRYSMIAVSFVGASLFLVGILVSDVKGYLPFLAISAALLVVTGLFVWKHLRLPILLALVGVSLFIIGVEEFFYGAIAALVLILLLGLVKKMESWRTALLIIAVAVAGFSVHVFIPVRSSLHPDINENDPSQSLEATIDFLERRQYQSQGMIERMFVRRAEWQNQFGVYARMGFWGFFDEQYGLTGRKFFILFLLGLFGVWETCRRKPEVGVFLVILLMVASVGLVLYMNFADGTRQNPVTGRDYLEVRDRDYFFTPGFMLFGLMIGLGVSGFLQYVRDMLRGFNPTPRRVILVCCLVLLFLPVYAVAGNFHYCDRSRNYIPYDYAWNLLISADDNAILFTGGDNDTFPLWCLQEVYGVRRDVKLICLSLANMDWYIKQIRDNMGLSIGLTDREIESLRPFRFPDGRVFRVQDQVIDALVAHHYGRIPVNFSVTVGSGSRKLNGYNIDSLMQMSALVYRLVDSAGGPPVEFDRTLEYFTGPGRFKYRGLNDPSIYKNETTLRLTRNVAGKFLTAAEALRNDGQLERAVDGVRFIIDKIPYADGAVESLAMLYTIRGEPDQVMELMKTTDYEDLRHLRTLVGLAYRQADEPDKAESVLTDLLTEYPSHRPALDELMSFYISQRDVQGMLTVLQTWVSNNPDDHKIRDALNELLKQMGERQQPGSDSL